MVSGESPLEGKVAIVTGGGTGLGKAMALALAKEGADVVVGARRLEPIELTAKEIRELGRRSLAVSTDVTDSQQVNRLVEQTLSQMGGLDILVNNAGIVRGQQRREFWEITDEEWHLGIDTNLSGAFFGCRAAAQHLVAQKSGKVINIASGEGLRGARGSFMYNIAKGGVIQLTRSLALTWAENNIQVNTIAPGFIDVSTLQPVVRQGFGGRMAEFNPVGRIGAPQDISSLCVFLASAASDYVTGGLFVVDGAGLAGGYTPTGYAPIINLKEE